jgi:glycosyltransferase involved in cell wall biosynthesis
MRDACVRRELACGRFLSVPSDAAARLVELHLPWKGKLEIIPHGLLQPVRERARRREIGLPLRVGSFGNLVPEKGLDLLVEALSHCGEEVELRLSGASPDPSYVEALRQRAMELGIPFVWTGPYRPEDRHPALDLDLAVFPSLCQETYGLVAEEALARGVPVVVSAKGALPERAAKGGIVVRSGGVMPLKVTLAGLLRSRRKLQALRNAIPTRFATIDEAARRYRALLAVQEVTP